MGMHEMAKIEIPIQVNMDTDEVIARLKSEGWAPVKHGHWIELWTGYKCSECARVLIIAPIAPFGNYCPYCGAKMDKDADDPSRPFADDVMMGEKT